MDSIITNKQTAVADPGISEAGDIELINWSLGIRLMALYTYPMLDWDRIQYN